MQRRGRLTRVLVAIGVLLAMMLASASTALAADTGTVTCNGVSLQDNQTALTSTIQVGDQITCTFNPDVPRARFMFMVGRGFSPLFGHSSTSTFTAGKPNSFASITVYWSSPGAGSVTATFPYQIVSP